MRLIIIRHGDPDYENDTVTEKGKREVELLAKRMKNEPVDAIYVSPLGRAKDTARPTEEALGMQGEVCPWLREFSYATVDLPHKRGSICWNLPPSYVCSYPELYSIDGWRTSMHIKASTIPEEFDRVTENLDMLLSEHGYVRDGDVYRVRERNGKTLVFFCHFGITGVLLSHLIRMSPFTFWQNCNTRTTSLTVLETEEREDGVANFSLLLMGDVSHLSD